MEFRDIEKRRKVVKNLKNKVHIPDFSSDKNKIRKTNPIKEVKVWKNEKAKTVCTIDTVIDLEIEEFMISLNRSFPNVEFSIFTNFQYNENERLMAIGPKIFVPKQRVNIGGVEYDEDAPEGFDCVIHKHPSGFNFWSVVDMDYINSNFEVSILFVDNRFTKGMARTKTKFGWIPVDLNCTIGRKFPTIEKEILSKIKKVSAPNHFYPDRVNQSYSKHPLDKNFLQHPIGMDECCYGEDSEVDDFFGEINNSKVQDEINKSFDA